MTKLSEYIERKMDWLAQRQTVIAENIANANTPNYKPKEIEPFDKVLSSTLDAQGAKGKSSPNFKMNTTQPGHLNGTVATSGGQYKVSAAKDVYEVKPSGNGVVLEQQMTDLAETTGQYQMMTGLYKKSLTLLKTALSGRN
jgi:flagellar basal-body rod protein FlgB